ncbi:MAG: type II toxin-antitoxin system death-on-curing family toxin [Plesiomonas shigelloides]
MNLIQFPPARVAEINARILSTERGLNGAMDAGRLEGALSRVDNAIAYLGLNDVFEIAAKYAASIAAAHAFSDANKRTGLAVALEYLSLNDYYLSLDNEQLADAVRDLVTREITEIEFADVLYSQYVAGQDSEL